MSAENVNSYKYYFDKAPTGLLLVDMLTGRVSACNVAAKKLLGQPILEGVLWSSLQCKEQVAMPMMADGMIVAQKYRLAEGGCVALDTAFTLLPPQEANARPQMLVQLTPCVERMQLEAERAELQKELAEELKLKALGRLAGGVAHDYNNLLAVLAGSLELIEREGLSSQRIRECRETLERARGLGRQILRLARNASPLCKPVEVGELIVRIGNLTGVGARREYEAGAAGQWVMTDPAELEAALINLITNAKEAVGDKGVVRLWLQHLQLSDTAHYTKGRLEAGEYVMLVVSDNGPGIPKELQERIFEPYYTTKAHKGIGLGLARVAASVEQMKGALELQSSPQSGTLWRMILPLAIAAGATKAIDEQKPEQEVRLPVVVVDDEPALVRLVQTLLKHEGYTTRGYTDPQKAWEELQGETEPFVIITDAKMPQMSGVALLQALRRANKRFGALLMSGYTEELQALPEAQVSVRLEKPVSVEELLQALKKAGREVS